VAPQGLVTTQEGGQPKSHSAAGFGSELALFWPPLTGRTHRREGNWRILLPAQAVGAAAWNIGMNRHLQPAYRH